MLKLSALLDKGLHTDNKCIFPIPIQEFKNIPFAITKQNFLESLFIITTKSDFDFEIC